MRSDDFSAAFQAIERAAESLPAAEIPAALGSLEALKGRLWARLVSPHPAEPIAAPVPAAAKASRILSAKEAGVMLGRSVWWIYRHASELPRVALSKGRKSRRERFGYSEASIAKWLREHERAGR